MNKAKSIGLILFVMAISTPAMAILKITIEGGQSGGIPIAVVPFEWKGEGKPPHVIDEIIQSDLQRSGRFDTLTRKDFLSQPHDHTQIKYKDWRLLKAENLVVGKVQELGNNKYRVQFQLFDVFKQKQLGGFRYNSVNGRVLRKLAHQISDRIYEILIGERGAFDTRIAYVTVEKQGKNRKRYLLRVADSDGYNPRTILDSGEPILSPSWSPSGKQLAYVSFEHGSSRVFVQRLADGKRFEVSGYEGINSAPAWSPDGKELALVLSREGDPEIYTMNLKSRKLKRITKNLAIDTEPAWSPDGKYMVFTSDRSGRPQIYRVPKGGGKAERLTYKGRYNARASYASDGKRLTLVTNQGNGYRIGVFYFDDRFIEEITDSRVDESPTFAPNGSMVLYASQSKGRGVLAAVSADGRAKHYLRFQQGDVREPAWSPYNR